MGAVRAAEAVDADARVDLLLFTLDGRTFAVRLGQVERVTAMAAFRPLPGAPAVVAPVKVAAFPSESTTPTCRCRITCA